MPDTFFDTFLINSVDTEAMAACHSVHLDGIMVASAIRADFDISVAMTDLENQLWRVLGYQPAQSRRAL